MHLAQNAVQWRALVYVCCIEMINFQTANEEQNYRAETCT
jgi:hypothetical protein